MTTYQREQLKDKIDLDVTAMKNEIASLEEKTQPVAPDCSLGRLTRSEMMIELEVYERALHEARIRLNKLLFASRSVDKDSYGVCEECEEEILFERMILVPESTHCVSCLSELNLA